MSSNDGVDGPLAARSCHRVAGLAQCQDSTLLIDGPFFCRGITTSLHGSSEIKNTRLVKKDGRNPECKGRSEAKLGFFEYW